MEHSHSPEISQSYADRKLAESLDVATRDLQPGPGYHLGLEGIPVPALPHKELEAFFGASLDTEAGVDIVLKYNDTTNRLILHELTYPLKSASGFAKLHWTETIGYIPLIEINNQPFTNESKYVNYAKVDRLIEQLGINQDAMTGDDSRDYPSWKAGLLAKTKGWKLREILEIPEMLTAFGSQTTTVINEEQVDNKSFAVTTRKSITQRIAMYHENIEGMQEVEIVDSTLEVTSTAFSSINRAYKRVSKKSFDPFVINDEREVFGGIRALPMTEDTYHSFQNALNEVIELRSMLESN